MHLLFHSLLNNSSLFFYACHTLSCWFLTTMHHLQIYFWIYNEIKNPSLLAHVWWRLKDCMVSKGLFWLSIPFLCQMKKKTALVAYIVVFLLIWLFSVSLNIFHLLRRSYVFFSWLHNLIRKYECYLIRSPFVHNFFLLLLLLCCGVVMVA